VVGRKKLVKPTVSEVVKCPLCDEYVYRVLVVDKFEWRYMEDKKKSHFHMGRAHRQVLTEEEIIKYYDLTMADKMREKGPYINATKKRNRPRRR